MASPQRVIITGASSGLGAALARHYAGRGATLGLIARRQSELERLRAAFTVACEIYPLDVRDGAAIDAAARDFTGKHGCPDIIIANAGVSVGTLTEFAEDRRVFQAVVDINLIGMVNSFQPFLSAMRARGNGTLAGIASVAGFRGLAGNGAYCASKSAAITWLEALRTELYGSGVSVVCVCPGYIDTPMTRVNRFRMPFLISADDAAQRIARAIENKRRLAVIPWPMALVSVLLRAMPGWLFDRLASRAPRKPRDVAV